MALRGLHEHEGRKNLQIKFVLQDPVPLTGKRETEILVPAAVGQSLLVAAVEAGIDIDHSCGGVCACSTCHVWVNRGGELLSEATDEEADRLDVAPMVKPKSRLSCQAIIQENAEPGVVQIEVEVPSWNRNLVRE